jgi:hypothetical protein
LEALANAQVARHCHVMKELIRTPNFVVISALQAALKADGIEAFEFDGPIADTMVGVAEFPRRLFVHEDDYEAARAIMIEFCPEEVERL